MNVEEFLVNFQDHLAPKLDTYEQAIYLYLFRHSRLVGRDEVVIGFKTARSRMACGVGEKGKPMSEGTAYSKLRSLESKGCIQIITTERTGSRIHVRLPHEIPGAIPDPVQDARLTLEEMDFFNVPDHRKMILARERNRCFYCLRSLNGDNHVIEHVSSRPVGGNSYRDVVAACRQCNNRKGSSGADDFLRTLLREQRLNDQEFDDRRSHLERLREGELKPDVC